MSPWNGRQRKALVGAFASLALIALSVGFLFGPAEEQGAAAGEPTAMAVAEEAGDNAGGRATSPDAEAAAQPAGATPSTGDSAGTSTYSDATREPAAASAADNDGDTSESSKRAEGAENARGSSSEEKTVREGEPLGSSDGPATGSAPADPGGAEAAKPARPDADPAPSPATVTVSVAVDSSAVGSPVSGSAQPTFEEGATVLDALGACGLSINASSGQFGTYVRAIGGLAEKEHGAGSGWTYRVNGATPMKACDQYVLADGDTVRWVYVTG